MPQNSDIKRWLEIANGLLQNPTAALTEDLPVKHILEFVAARPELWVKRDQAGNVLVGYPGGSENEQNPLVLVAHLDHPGFWIEGATEKKAKLSFQGWVHKDYAKKGTKVAFFERGQVEPTGKGKITRIKDENGNLKFAKAKIKSGKAVPGGFAMWDFTPFKIKKGRIVTRGCDDLLGAAAALCALDELVRIKPPKASVWVLFTRSEEIGFYGTLWAAKKQGLPKTSKIISLECSRALPSAPQGNGVIVRVGDAASLFDAPLTEALRQACIKVKERDLEFKFQRKLMDGGSCEASVYCAEGYRSSGLALPLGNYHNQSGLDGGKKKMGPEHVMVTDFAAEVQLLVELASMHEELEKMGHVFGKRIEKLWEKAEKALIEKPLLY